ncbi:hypothetical protein N7468_003543 [Penicillium chermesinum]|uniref:Initiator tRNA phosphoribosyl transferase n=1 Tax=Penicillium chermesinum TaxID=63820 RepID=A0A9W9P6K8_9EURO|nr:uncharacterized protein N7468_003543 [Penicillium chermesinum]KAJ5238924.1 hypothetical protein N7468_003543 [Penicillium chermesinum]KAJ6164564.1 hypothetical protein N7470_003236 [Penicillium chermesinum]
MEPASSFLTLESLHFPSAEQSISQTLSALRRSALSVANRLQSIEADAAFAQEVAEYYDLPLVANERCGSWYIPPTTKVGSAYFKSTDGHTGQWDFSFRRLNLQLLPLAKKYGGCVIVDSTRRGKLMPDALSKTIPIWCAVLNRALFPSETDYHEVHLPPNYLGRSEEAQIEARIDGFVTSLKRADRVPYTGGLGESRLLPPSDLEKGSGYCLFVLCSASRRVHGAEMSEGGYIQGAGDDSEAWAHGLTPPVFWANQALLKQTSEEGLPRLIEELVAQYQRETSVQSASLISPTKNLYISITGETESNRYDLVIDCHGDPVASEGSDKRLNLGLASGKLGSRDLRKALDKVRDFVSTRLGATDPSQSLLVTCETGKDLSAGTLLAIICLFYDEQGEFDVSQSNRSIGKQYIRQRLAWIVSSKHDVNPSRSTLQSVNAFLM